MAADQGDGQVTNIASRAQLTVDDVDIIKSSLSEPVLKAMRAVMVNINPTNEDRGLVSSTFKDTRLLALIRQRFLPVLNKDADIGTNSDVWMGMEEMISGQPPHVIEQALGYKMRVIPMTEQGLSLLENPHGKPVDLSVGVDPVADPLGTWLMARNMYIKHVETQLSLLWMITVQYDKIRKGLVDAKTKEAKAINRNSNK